MNGVLNLSVLDGWWAEGYVPGAGWALKEQITYQDNRLQDELDAETLYNIIGEQITAAFYNRDAQGIPTEWVAMMKKCFTQISPHFTMKRQLDDYYRKFYHKLMNRSRLLSANDNENVRILLKWRENVLAGWNDIECVGVDYPKNDKNTYCVGDRMQCRLELRLGSLRPQDVKVEMVFVTAEDHGRRPKLEFKVPFVFETERDGIYTFVCCEAAQRIGVWDCAVRVIPNHELLPHDQDFNIVRWI